MVSLPHPSPAACPACVIAPAAEAIGQRLAAAADADHLVLSVPAVHCAACISSIELGLMALPDVQSARVNLTQKRVMVAARRGTDPDLLVARIRALGYDAREMDAGALAATTLDATGRDLLMRLGVAGFSMMNVMLLSVAVWSGAEGPTRDLFHWVSALIALPTVVFSGKPFFASAWAALRVGRLGMDVPISLALILASSISVYETTQSGHHAYFDAAVMLCFFLLAGRYLDHRTRALARSAAAELAALEVPRAIRRVGGVETTVPVADLSVGDVVLVRPGGRIPVDGRVLDGGSEIDRSLLTGESLPVHTTAGAMVSAGEMNLTGLLVIDVTAAGRDTSLHRMADLVAVAEAGRGRYTSLADRAARAYSPLVHLLSFSAFGYWMWQTGGDLRFAINISAAVLIITCPCALGLAVPAVATAASGMLFRKGLVIKDGTALERLAGVSHVVFDKTGTLTLGVPQPLNLADHPRQVLSVALALAQASGHPLSQALATALRAPDFTGGAVEEAPVQDRCDVAGNGVEGSWNGGRVRLGRAGWVGASAVAQTAAYLTIGSASHVFPFEDRLRPGAAALVAGLQAQGIGMQILSGDNRAVVAALAARLGIDDWQAECLPAAKIAAIEALRRQGQRVLMVGDGLNDTGALVAADVSISPSSALDAARVASDIVLLGQDLAPIADALRIARLARRRIKQNFAISAAYNLVAVPLALVGLATPLAAALAMSLSSITVSLNALRMR